MYVVLVVVVFLLRTIPERRMKEHKVPWKLTYAAYVSDESKRRGELLKKQALQP